MVNRWVAAAIKRSVDLGFLSIKEIRFGVDKQILQKLMRLKDKFIHGLLVQCRQSFRFYAVVKNGSYDDIYQPEFRGLDPLVKKGNWYVRLTQLDSGYRDRLNKLRESFSRGIKIKFKKPRKKKSGFQDFQEFNGGSFAGVKYKVEVNY